jgi:hypothetical protein
MAINLMIEFGKVGTDIEVRKGLLGRTDPLQNEFMKIYLSYLSQLKFDTYSHWTEYERDFLEDLGFEGLEEQISKQTLY